MTCIDRDEKKPFTAAFVVSRDTARKCNKQTAVGGVCSFSFMNWVLLTLWQVKILFGKVRVSV